MINQEYLNLIEQKVINRYKIDKTRSFLQGFMCGSIITLGLVVLMAWVVYG